ncbi:hypothetical protein BHE74_00052718 [Ensete ventricosum]|nr:hypothetical protein BHE74_00052718 [Ensete ventricosum]
MRRFTSVFLSFLLFLVLLSHVSSRPPAVPARRSIVGETCKQIARDDPNVDFTFCSRSLRSVHGSDGADLRGLAMISLKLAVANATGAGSRAKALLKGGGLSRYYKSCLAACGDVYADAVSDLRDAAGMIRSGRLVDARVHLSAAVDAPVVCEDGFRDGGLASPLTEEDGDLMQLAVIALAITVRLG